MPSLSVALVVLASIGCPTAQDPTVPIAGKPVSSERESTEPIRELVSRILDDNRTQRRLSSDTHGAWQILHGILAYGEDFTMETPQGEKRALEAILVGEMVDGFQPRRGDALGDPSRSGLRMDMQPTTKIGQGHRDQWLAIVAQCQLPLETELRASDHAFTISDWLRQAEYDVPRNLELEFSWSLIALTAYHDTDHSWTARDGQQYSTDLLLESELEQSLESSVCGGTHRLIGIAMARNKRRAEGKPMLGVWARADQLLAQHVELARQNQNPDGSYSADYLHRPGWTRDLGDTLGTTGHVLEFLAFAADDQTLRQPWVERSARRICEVLEQCRDIDLECGVLYHALHGLNEYHARL